MCNNSKSQGKRSGSNGTDIWKGPTQEDNNEFEQMPRVIRNNIPIRHDDSRWSIFGAVCVKSRQQSSAVQAQVSTRITGKERLGRLVQLLAQLYSHRGQTSHPSGRMDNSNRQEMDMVYYNSSTDDLHRIEKGKVHHYLRTANYRRTRSSTSYDLAWEEDLLPTFKRGAPTSVLTNTNTKVNKQRRCSICQRTASTNRFLGIPRHMGRDMDVGKHR